MTPETSSLSSDNGSTAVCAPAAAAAKAMPLDWTKVKRKRKRANPLSSSSSSEYYMFCCEDPSCPIDADRTAAVEEEQRKKKATAGSGQKITANKYVTLRGKALFCLHSLDCTWFQGRFVDSQMASVANRRVKTLGLLVQQREDIDECLQCHDGGYREIDLSIYSKKIAGKREREKVVMERLECTGGDMLCIRNTDDVSEEVLEDVSFEAERIITGQKVEPLVKRYFPNLVASNQKSVLEQLPDCAVVLGEMKLRLSKEFFSQSTPPSRKDNDDDDWLE